MTIGIKTIVMTKQINFRCCAEEKIRRRQLLSLLIQIKRKLKRRRKQKATGEATYGEGASRPPRRLNPFPRLRFCFRLCFNLRLI